MAVFKDEAKSLEERLAALERIARLVLEQQPDLLGGKLTLPVYRTVAHQKLLEALVGQAVQLAGGHFKQWNGVPCRTLVGMCGIGKSTMMELFAYTISTVYPLLITVYVSGEGLTDSTNSFRTAPLRQLLVRAAVEHGVSIDSSIGADALDVGLRQANKRLLILLDEVDELYRLPLDDVAQVKIVRETLGTLGTLGGQTSGLYSVILCGSSASTHRLICGKPAFLESTYPLVKGGVPNLNDTKYSRLVIPSPRCTDWHQTRVMQTADLRVDVSVAQDCLRVLGQRKRAPRRDNGTRSPTDRGRPPTSQRSHVSLS